MWSHILEHEFKFEFSSSENRKWAINEIKLSRKANWRKIRRPGLLGTLSCTYNLLANEQTDLANLI